MTKQIAKVGDIFWLPIDDGTYVLGQIVEIQKRVLNSITCAFFDIREKEPKEITTEGLKPISIQFVTKDSFNRGRWVRVGNGNVSLPEAELPYRETMNNGWIGAKVIGSGIITSFLSAFYELRDWNEMKDPEYYSKLLKPGVTRE